MDLDVLIARVNEEVVLDELLTQMREAKEARSVFVGEVLSVEKVKTQNDRGEPMPGKAKIVYRPANADEPDYVEEIETDWLNRDPARACARQAHQLLGRRAVFWKLNSEDPSGKVSQGFRRVIWVGPA